MLGQDFYTGAIIGFVIGFLVGIAAERGYKSSWPMILVKLAAFVFAFAYAKLAYQSGKSPDPFIIAAFLSAGLGTEGSKILGKITEKIK
jgi:hypothetical protein